MLPISRTAGGRGTLLALIVSVVILLAVPLFSGALRSEGVNGGDVATCVDTHGIEDVCRVAGVAEEAPLGATHGPLAACPQLRPGDTGDCVEKLQLRLRDAGVDVPATGRFGALTTEAVRRMQREAQPPIPDSGIVGLRTQLALEKVVAGRIDSSSVPGARIVSSAREVMAGQFPGWAADTVPYVWGGGHGRRPGPTTGTCVGYEGAGPCEAERQRGLDCSGFTRYAVALATGRDVLGPGNTDDQRARTTEVEMPRPGDLVLFGTEEDTHHVAIYLGEGNIIHAPDTGHDVEIGSLNDFDDIVGFRRVEA